MCASLKFDAHRPFSVRGGGAGDGAVRGDGGVRGAEAAASVVLLHGVGAARWMWWRQVADLSRDHHVLVPDLPGHGETNRAGVAWGGLPDAADRVAELIAAQADGGRAHVVGLSLGGHVAMALLERHPGVVDSAILSGVTVRPWPNRWFLGVHARVTVASLKRESTPARMARSMGLPPAGERALAEGIRAMDLGAYGPIFREVAAYSATPEFLSAPNRTLVVAGGKEGKIIRSAVAELPERMPTARGAIAPGVGHAWNIEAPELFTGMIRRWVAEGAIASGLRPVAG